MKPRFIFIFLIVGTLGVFVVCPREPRYHGRTLTYWLQQSFAAAGNETQQIEEAQSAIRAIGAKLALPTLLNLVEAKDDPVSLWLIARTQKYRERFLRWRTHEQYSVADMERTEWHSATDFQWYGERGFEVLGTNAAPAAAQLGKLLDQGDRLHLLIISRCLASIGKPAEPVICQALTNQNADVRKWALDQAAAVTDDVGVYIARIKPRLHDSSSAVRATTVDAIGAQTSAPELAVPLLLDALNDEAVSANAANALANFGTNALVAIPQLTRLVESKNESAASAALKTLIIIAPRKSLPLFTNFLAQERPGINDALCTLAGVLPDEALPIILHRLQSPDLGARRAAFGLLSRCPATPLIDSTMQAIALGSDSEFVPAAKDFLTKEYETNHPDASLFPDEPSYQGKRLGEWLVMRNESGDQMTDAATNAIFQMGTNALPALFKRLTYVRPPYCFPANGININATWGFITLGEAAKPALPELGALMDNTNSSVAVAALIATCGTGSNAMPFLIKGMTNQFANVRSLAASALTEGVGDKFPEQRKEAIPLFVKLLNDPDDDVRLNATNQLKQIDPAAAAIAGIK